MTPTPPPPGLPYDWGLEPLDDEQPTHTGQAMTWDGEPIEMRTTMPENAWSETPGQGGVSEPDPKAGSGAIVPLTDDELLKLTTHEPDYLDEGHDGDDEDAVEVGDNT